MRRPDPLALGLALTLLAAIGAALAHLTLKAEPTMGTDLVVKMSASRPDG
jgi:hypothetical protein